MATVLSEQDALLRYDSWKNNGRSPSSLSVDDEEVSESVKVSEKKVELVTGLVVALQQKQESAIAGIMGGGLEQKCLEQNKGELDDFAHGKNSTSWKLDLEQDARDEMAIHMFKAAEDLQESWDSFPGGEEALQRLAVHGDDQYGAGTVERAQIYSYRIYSALRIFYDVDLPEACHGHMNHKGAEVEILSHEEIQEIIEKR